MGHRLNGANYASTTGHELEFHRRLGQQLDVDEHYTSGPGDEKPE